MRVAAIDIGTNTTRLLIADSSSSGLVDVERTAQVTALGRGVDRTGRLADDAIERATDVLGRYARSLSAASVVRMRAVATSAVRDASNREAFLDAAETALGFRPEVISGDEEAVLSFTGATLGRDDSDEAVVVDAGGGSTEFVASDGGVSVDIGSIRLTERCLTSHPASAVDLDRARTEAARIISTRDLPDRRFAIGVAGTWTSLAAIHLELPAYDRAAVEGTVLSLDDIRHLVNRLSTLSLSEKQAIPSLDPKRASVILGGAVVAEAALQALALDRVTVTEHDLLDGVCLSALN